MNFFKSCVALFALAFAPIATVSATALFSNPLADGSRPNPGGTNYNLNGNCMFSCTEHGYVADNFTLSNGAALSSVDFIGIRTGNPPDLAISGTINWLLFSDDGLYQNAMGVGSRIGTILYSGSSNFERVETLLTIGGDYSTYRFSLPSIALSAGNYFLALQARVDGASGGADDTTLYMANGYGDGVWAWRFAPPGVGPLDSMESNWSNPNSQLIDGGIAFSLNGESTSVPEPSSLAMLCIGLACIGSAHRLAATSRRNQRGQHRFQSARPMLK